MGICHLSLITKPLDKLCVVHSFKRNTPLPLPPSLIFMASLPRYQKTYLLCTISLEYSTTAWKTALRPVLRHAGDLFIYWEQHSTTREIRCGSWFQAEHSVTTGRNFRGVYIRTTESLNCFQTSKAPNI